MWQDSGKSPDHLTIRVTGRTDPVSQVTELDAIKAGKRYRHIVVRGPLFGFAEQTPKDRPRWRLLDDMDAGFPQDARDALNSHLWWTAKDDAEDHHERRRLLEAVARLEQERTDEVRVGRTRYRIVRADEFARISDGRLEPPRHTDPDDKGWDPGTKPPSYTEGFLVDHAAGVTLTNGLERLGLREHHYTSERFPQEIREDSARAVTTHPGLVLLPTAFRLMERFEHSWRPVTGAQHRTPQDARRSLVHYLTRIAPQLEDLSERDIALYAKAADRFTRQQRTDELHVRGRTFHIIRVERMMRIGPDGPEPPRPSDEDHQEPTRLHPPMDEWGTIHHETAPEDDDDE